MQSRNSSPGRFAVPIAVVVLLVGAPVLGVEIRPGPFSNWCPWPHCPAWPPEPPTEIVRPVTPRPSPPPVRSTTVTLEAPYAGVRLEVKVAAKHAARLRPLLLAMETDASAIITRVAGSTDALRDGKLRRRAERQLRRLFRQKLEKDRRHLVSVRLVVRTRGQ